VGRDPSLIGAFCASAFATAACFHPVYDRPTCGPGDACPSGLICSHPQEICVADPGALDAGDAASSPPDGSKLPDGSPPDARTFCYGAAPFSICFASAPTGAIDINAATVFDTVTGTASGITLTCVPTLSGATGYCVLAANTISISANLRATGAKPLVLLAVDSITTTAAGTIDVSSHRGPPESLGAGGDPAVGCNAGTPPGTAVGTSGGGAGGSFLGTGASGGIGGGGGGAGGTHGIAVATVTVVRGGCPGQDGAGGGKGAHGHGGGAVFLIAGTSITVGGTINAGGEGGAGGTQMDSGGGGGGAGGMIGFDAASIMVTGTLIANGGGGAEGSGSSSDGNPGGDSVTVAAAPGGRNGTTNGGDGGNGSAGAAAGPGATGSDGNPAGGGGGGGGGGGAGLIKGPPASLGSNVSPAATP
jgi:hypothetical protein